MRIDNAMHDYNNLLNKNLSIDNDFYAVKVTHDYISLKAEIQIKRTNEFAIFEDCKLEKEFYSYYRSDALFNKKIILLENNLLLDHLKKPI